MLILPFKRIAFITPPRTGSTSLYSAVRESGSQWRGLYRHAPAQMLPTEYKDFTLIGTIRDPIERLWSLFQLGTYGEGPFTYQQADDIHYHMFDYWLNKGVELFEYRGVTMPEGIPVVSSTASLQNWYSNDYGAWFCTLDNLNLLTEALLGVTVSKSNSSKFQAHKERLQKYVSNDLKRLFEWEYYVLDQCVNQKSLVFIPERGIENGTSQSSHTT